MNNVKALIASHNGRILNNKDKNEEIPECRCRKYPCPMRGKCESSDIVYKAKICEEQNTLNNKIYYGLCSTKFK